MVAGSIGDHPWVAAGVDPVDECREELAVIVDHRLAVAEGI